MKEKRREDRKEYRANGGKGREDGRVEESLNGKGRRWEENALRELVEE